MLCITCGNEGVFSIASTTKTKVYLKRTCAACCKAAAAQHKLLKLTHTAPSDSRCQCCGTVARLSLDHCHASNTFRGFLCMSCNVSIGKLSDSEEGLRRALDYIVRSKDTLNSPSVITKEA